MTYPGSSPSLQAVDLTVARGEFVSIVGPSGCGKSTLLRLIAGLRSPTSGKLQVHGRVPTDSATRSAFVFQDANLLPWRNVLGNIRLPFEIDERLSVATRLVDANRRDANRRDGDQPGLPNPPAASQSSAKSIDKLIDEALQLIGLTKEDARKLPAQLSGGMRMRVSLARALVTQPEILLLDEPFASLDDILRQQLNEDLQRIWWQQRWTAVFVTHNVSEAVFQSQRVLVMSRAPGRLIHEINVPFEYPRDQSLRATAAFAELAGQVSEKLRAAAEVAS